MSKFCRIRIFFSGAESAKAAFTRRKSGREQRKRHCKIENLHAIQDIGAAFTKRKSRYGIGSKINAGAAFTSRKSGMDHAQEDDENVR